MAVPYHTHSFDIPAASKEDVVAGVATDKVVTPSSLGSAAIRKVEDFATAEQGKKASTAIQKSDLASVALTGNYHELKELPTLGSASAKDASAFATFDQGHKADTAVQPGDMQKSLDTKFDKAGGKIDGDLKVNGYVTVNGRASFSSSVTGEGFEVFAIQGDGSRLITGELIDGGDINGNIWGKDGHHGKLSDYLKANTVQPKDLTSVAKSGSYHDLKDLPDLGSAAAKDVSAFATAEQGKKADTALQPQSLGTLARKDKVAVSDIDAQGKPSEKLFLCGDGSWKEPPGGGKIDGDLKVNGYVTVNGRASFSSSVTGEGFEVFAIQGDGSRLITGELIDGGDINGNIWGKDGNSGKLSDYLKARLPQSYALVDDKGKVASIVDGLDKLDVSGLRVVPIAEERDDEAEMQPIGYDTGLAEETGTSGDVSGDIETIEPPRNPYLPDLINWRFHAAIDLEKGLRDRIDAAIARMRAPKQAINRAKLARKTMFQRSDPLFDDLVADPKFGMTKDQFDTFWKNATILN